MPSTPPWNTPREARHHQPTALPATPGEKEDPLQLTKGREVLRVEDEALCQRADWGTQVQCEHASPYCVAQVLMTLLPDLRRLYQQPVTTLYVLADTRAHVEPFAICLLNRLSWKGPHQEKTSALFFHIQEGSGLKSLHYTSAGPVLISILRTVLPHTHLVLMDHDTMLTALWEVREVCELASAAPNAEGHHGTPGADTPLPLGPRKNVWAYGPEGNGA